MFYRKKDLQNIQTFSPNRTRDLKQAVVYANTTKKSKDPR